MYRIVISNDAKKDLKELSKKAPQAVKKMKLLKFQFYLLSGTTRNSQSSQKYYQASHHYMWCEVLCLPSLVALRHNLHYVNLHNKKDQQTINNHVSLQNDWFSWRDTTKTTLSPQKSAISWTKSQNNQITVGLLIYKRGYVEVRIIC